MSLIVISSERFAEHQTPPGHPERPERADVMDVVANEWRRRHGEVVAPREATREQLARVHDAEYLPRIAETAGPRGPSTPTPTRRRRRTRSRSSRPAPRWMRSSAWSAVTTRAVGARSPARPPRGARSRDGLLLLQQRRCGGRSRPNTGRPRVAIVDYDVHHGNGTQHIFERDPTVLYCSIHQYPYYPGTGPATEIGEGDGAGLTVNVPLEAGATDDDYHLVFDEVVIPMVRAVQAGPAPRVGRIRCPRARSARRHAPDDGGVRGDDHGAAARGGRVLRRPYRCRHRRRLRSPGVRAIRFSLWLPSWAPNTPSRRRGQRARFGRARGAAGDRCDQGGAGPGKIIT